MQKLILTATVLALAVPLLAKNNTGRQVEMFIEEEAVVSANRALIKLQVTKSAKTLADGSRQCTQAFGTLSAVLEKAGVAPENIITRTFNSYPTYGFYNERTRQYQVLGFMEVELSDPQTIEKSLDLIDQGDGDIMVAAIEYASTAEDSVRAALITAAAERAKARKKAYEFSFNIKLKLKEIVENAEGEFEPGKVPDGGIPMKREGSGGMIDPESEKPEAPVVKVKVSLTVVYQIMN